MSIIINGMEMPKNCDECFFVGRGFPDWCSLPQIPKDEDEIDDTNNRPDWCPLEEVQETHDKRTETHACDLIERQAAIDAIGTILAPTPTQKDIVEDCLEIIENLPSAQPKLKLVDITDISEIFEPKITEEEIQMMQELEAAEIEKAYQLGMEDAQPVDKNIYVPINDTISRQAARDTAIAMRKKCDTDNIDDYLDMIVEALEVLPSAQPETIRCKDCKYGEPNGKYGCTAYHYKLYEAHAMKPNDFCSHAERKTDG